RRGRPSEFTGEEENRGLGVEADVLQFTHDQPVIENERNEADDVRSPANFQELARALGQDSNAVLLPHPHGKQPIRHPMDAFGKFEMGYPLPFKHQTDTVAKQRRVAPNYVTEDHVRAEKIRKG
ncbi:MAG: hypothetical protein WAM77_28235, partial [Xanthobacteraceae bacterium]